MLRRGINLQAQREERWLDAIGALPALTLPEDEHLVATIHSYSPFRFTHQGGSWIDGAA